MVSASWPRRKSSNRSACAPRAPRWTSDINKVRKRLPGHSSLIASLPMREQLTESRDSVMTIQAAEGAAASVKPVKMMDRAVAVANTKPIGCRDCRADPDLGTADRGFHVFALRQTCGDGGR